MRFHILRRVSHERHWLYFVEAPAVGMMKIGVTDDIDRRFSCLQLGSPVSLVLRHAVRGRTAHEAGLHRAFRDERRHGEWFVASERLLSFVDDLKRSGVEAVDAMLDYALTAESVSRAGWMQRRLNFHSAGLMFVPSQTCGQTGVGPLRARDRQRVRARRLWTAIEQLWRETKAS